MEHKYKLVKKLKTVFDVLFIMLLCFATLLATMLLQGGLLVGGEGINYKFGIVSFLSVFVSVLLYIFYILKHSKKELEAIINRIYPNDV